MRETLQTDPGQPGRPHIEKRSLVSVVAFIIMVYSLMFFISGKVMLMELPPPPEKKKATSEEIIASGNTGRLDKRYTEMNAEAFAEDLDKLEMFHKKMERFKPPENGHLTKDQVGRFHGAYRGAVREFNDFKKYKIRGVGPGTSQAFTFAALAPVMIPHLRLKHLAKANISKREANWISDRMMETALFAINRKLETGPSAEWEIKHMPHLRDNIAKNLSVIDYDEDGNQIPDPDHVDLTRVSQHNLRLFLKDPEKFRYFSVNFNPSGTVMQFDTLDILQNAQAEGLPE